MSKPAFLPTPTQIGREALIVIGGAIVAALIIGNLPSVRAWINEQWGNTPRF